MPVNATPEYEKAEERYRSASTPDEQLAALQEMLRLVPKHKGSEKVQAEIKRKISTLRRELTRGGKSGGYVDPYHIPPSGAGQVTLVGLPNTGKSSVVAAVSHAPVKVADYPFSTTMPAPGMWAWQDVQIELVDTPPIAGDRLQGGLVHLLRSTDVVVVVADAASVSSLDQVETTRRMLAERDIELFDCPATDIPAEYPRARPGLIAVTHADVVGWDEIATMAELLDDAPTVCGLDCVGGDGFDRLADNIWRLLHVVRVYTKRPGQKAEWRDPYTLPIVATIEDLARTIHRELPDKFKYARIWGDSRHPGQQVNRNEALRDRDMVEIHD